MQELFSEVSNQSSPFLRYFTGKVHQRVMTIERTDSFDWQSCIAGIGVNEYFKLGEQKRFIDSINPYLAEDDQLSEYHPRETHARVPFQLRDLHREVVLPDSADMPFDTVYLQIAVDTNDLARVLLYGSIDTEAFIEARDERYVDSGEEFRLQNHGLDVLRDTQSELSRFLREDVEAGFFTREVEPWADERGKDTDHPGIWFYDFTEAEPSSFSEFQQRRRKETLFIGLGKKDRPEQGFTPYADGRCVIHGDGRDYWVTPLGSFPFRYFLIRFQKESQPNLAIKRKAADPDFGIPDDVERGIVPLARSYTHLFWSIASYNKLSFHAPEKILKTKDFQDELDAMTDREKAELLDSLHDGNKRLDEFWHRRQEQFSSIKTVRRERGGYAEREDAVTQPLINAAEDIESLCEDQVARFSERYQQLINRVQTHLEANVGITGLKLSVVLFALTLANVIAQLPTILSSQYAAPLLIILVIFVIPVLWIVILETAEQFL